MSLATLASQTARHQRVLLVDDEDVSRYRLERALTRHGFVTVAVSSAAAAIERLRHGRFDVVVTETSLPDGTGLDVFRAARERYELVTVVFLGTDPELPSRLGSVRYCCRQQGTAALFDAVVDVCGVVRLLAPSSDHLVTAALHAPVTQTVSAPTA